MNAQAELKPFVKWVGGKQKLSATLVDYFPREYETYYEPFVGGGSLLFRMRPPKAIINDENQWLINTYRAIRSNWKRVAAILDSIPNEKETFLEIRAMAHEKHTIYDQAAYFIYLNKTCFRGLFRVNKKGQFNVPYGNYDRPYYDADMLRNVSRYLKNVEIRCGDFADALEGVNKKSFVYFDPPYYKLGGYSDFNRYTHRRFSEDDHRRLVQLCHELHDRNIPWAVSNSDTPFVKKLYRDFTIHPISNRREINLKSQKRQVSELLITNY